MISYEPSRDPGAGPVYDVVVLAGGAARRLGGADKPGVRVGG
ncbi:molybdenum cofactor guanylyltransferase, partial [Streptomyces sp. 12257]|nr:molybdenum cofactor guanylyltransferase [Streptomyces sp. 12257]